MGMTIGVVIPTIGRNSLASTLASLDVQQLGPDHVVVVHDDDRRGAAWARNYGVTKLDENLNTDWLVFSDDDVWWQPWALKDLHTAITSGNYDFSYGRYLKEGRVYCKQDFNVKLLRKRNYISTMSMIRRDAFPGFDEDLSRLQDWDLWLTMVEQGSEGIYCGALIFATEENGGISSGDDWAEAERKVKRKHGLK